MLTDDEIRERLMVINQEYQRTMQAAMDAYRQALHEREQAYRDQLDALQRESAPQAPGEPDAQEGA